MRRLLLLLTLVATVGLAATPAVAHESAGGGAKNLVMAFNYADNSALSRSGILVSPIASDNVESENLAYAEASCNDCRTVSAAMQVVLITSNASVIRPTNAAVAVNQNCSSCATFAGAYQYVITTGGQVYLSTEGQAEVQRIRQEVAAIAASDLAFPELAAQLDALYEQLKAVIDSELVHAGVAFQATTDRQVSTLVH